MQAVRVSVVRPAVVVVALVPAPRQNKRVVGHAQHAVAGVAVPTVVETETDVAEVHLETDQGVVHCQVDPV